MERTLTLFGAHERNTQYVDVNKVVDVDKPLDPSFGNTVHTQTHSRSGGLGVFSSVILLGRSLHRFEGGKNRGERSLVQLHLKPLAHVRSGATVLHRGQPNKPPVIIEYYIKIVNKFSQNNYSFYPEERGEWRLFLYLNENKIMRKKWKITCSEGQYRSWNRTEAIQEVRPLSSPKRQFFWSALPA